MYSKPEIGKIYKIIKPYPDGDEHSYLWDLRKGLYVMPYEISVKHHRHPDGPLYYIRIFVLFEERYERVSCLLKNWHECFERVA